MPEIRKNRFCFHVQFGNGQPDFGAVLRKAPKSKTGSLVQKYGANIYEVG